MGLLVLDKDTNVLTIYDSGEDFTRTAEVNPYSWSNKFIQWYSTISETNLFNPDVYLSTDARQQTNTPDCGMFTSQYAIQHLHNKCKPVKWTWKSPTEFRALLKDMNTNYSQKP